MRVAKYPANNELRQCRWMFLITANPPAGVGASIAFPWLACPLRVGEAPDLLHFGSASFSDQLN